MVVNYTENKQEVFCSVIAFDKNVRAPLQRTNNHKLIRGRNDPELPSTILTNNS